MSTKIKNYFNLLIQRTGDEIINSKSGRLITISKYLSQIYDLIARDVLILNFP